MFVALSPKIISLINISTVLNVWISEVFHIQNKNELPISTFYEIIGRYTGKQRKIH